MEDINLSETLQRIVEVYSKKLELSPDRKEQFTQILKFAYKEGSINGRKSVIKDKVDEPN